MAFQDKTLTCRDCGKDFVWSASEQEFYQQKGFQNSPVRCPDDRAAKKARMDGGRGGGSRQMHEITCSNCGRNDSVPFQPRGDRPVLCGDCFRKQRDGELDMNDNKHDHSDKKESKPDSAEEKEVADENPEEDKPQAE